MKKLLLAVLITANFNIYAQNVSQENMKLAVDRVRGYIYAKYADEGVEKGELNKNVWYLGKGSSDDGLDIFLVEASYTICSGNGCEIKALFISSGFNKMEVVIDEDNNKEFKIRELDELPYAAELKQTKQAPNPEFLITHFEFAAADARCCPSMEYQQKFRFNNKTLKFEPIGKKHFVGKKK